MSDSEVIYYFFRGKTHAIPRFLFESFDDVGDIQNYLEMKEDAILHSDLSKDCCTK